MIDAEKVLEGLNDAQREAVLATEGPVLILAGAGSGKTRVITHRVAYLIGSGKAAPYQIVAVTFTNKAAGEMKERLARLLGADGAGARIGTFHALCLRILRKDGPRIGLPSNFQIYDTADQLGVIRALLKDLGIEESSLAPRAVLSRISHAKNAMISAEEFARQAVFPDAKTVAQCYAEYQARLKKAGAVDFDDLILETLRLFSTQQDVAQRYARGCRYLLVDEYQDTNRCQYLLIRALAAAHRNLCCVGDSDQSIYKFRGADISNILEFESDYPDAKVVRLERNYRSTKTVLKAASAVIEKNDRRHAKSLWTENDEGLPIHYHRSRDDRDEAEAITRIVASLSEIFPTGEIGILYRTNNQSRLIEEALVRAGIRYRIVGSLRFYERKEIKDLLAYLRLLLVPDDDAAFARIVNTPVRGIGRTTLDVLGALAAESRISLYRAARRAVSEHRLPARAENALAGFLETIDALRARAGTAAGPDSGLDRGIQAFGRLSVAPEALAPGGLGLAGLYRADGTDGPGPTETEEQAALENPVAPYGTHEEDETDEEGNDARAGNHPLVIPLITSLLEAIQFREHLEKSHPGDHEDRGENVDALVSAAAEYDEQAPGGGLQGFLDRSALRGDTDDVQGDTGVTLLTIHSAKGLEYSAVVLAGLEENLFPHIRSSESTEDLEEERRLCYVAITRAKKRLVVTNAAMRRSFGDFVENPPSRFLDEIPQTLVVYSESSPWGGVQGDPLRAAGAPGERRSAPSGFMAPGAAAAGSVPRGSVTRGPWPSRDEASASSYSRAPRRTSASGPRVVTRPFDPGAPLDDFAVGRIVTHPMFGRGTILHKEGAGDTLKLTIRFQNSGTRKILPRHTTLVVHD